MKRSFLLPLMVSSLLWGSASAENGSTAVSDKLLHAAGGAGISLMVGYSTGKPWLGLASGWGCRLALRLGRGPAGGLRGLGHAVSSAASL